MTQSGSLYQILHTLWTFKTQSTGAGTGFWSGVRRKGVIYAAQTPGMTLTGDPYQILHPDGRPERSPQENRIRF